MRTRLRGMNALIAAAFAHPGICTMAKAADNLDDILGGSGGKGKKAAAPAKVAKAAPAKGGKAAPAKAAKAKAPAKKGSSGPKAAKGEGKYYFPKDGKEFLGLAAKIKTVKKKVSSKDLAAALKTETWKVRLVAVELEKQKAIKVDRSAKLYVIGPR